MRLVGLMLSLGVIVWGIVLGTPLIIFVDLSSVIIVLGIGFGSLAFAHGFSSLGLLFRSVLADPEKSDAAYAAELAHTAGRTFVASGWLGVLIGVIQMSSQMESMSHLGPAFSVCMLTAFYGHAADWLLWMPTERRLRVQASS